MKILVAVKRVVDFNVKVRVKADGSGVETANVKFSINPFDEIAVEEAVKLKEAGVAKEVVAVSIGPAKAEEILRTAQAIGADRAIHVITDEEVQPLGVAKILKKIVEEEKPELVIMGKQAIDDDSNQTGQMLAAMLGWGQGTFAFKLSPHPNLLPGGEGNNPLPLGEGRVRAVEVVREVDGGLSTVSLKLPAIVTADLRLNQPRYATLPNIMKARSKPLAKKTPAELGVDIKPRLQIIKVEEPKKRQGGRKVKDAAELVDKLKNEAKVL